MFNQQRVGFVSVSVRMVIAATLVLGVAYPLTITGIGQLFLSHNANGSLLEDSSGTVRGSELLAQDFTDGSGNPLPQYFQPRPSASSWDPLSSGGSNLGPNSLVLEKQVTSRKSQLEASNPAASGVVPADALTASASGLDPHVSWEFFEYQLAGVAQSRGISEQQIMEVANECQGASPHGKLVNVTCLNFQLDAQQPAK